jgi:ribosomal protein S18 acetylase RimI-like enzyme
MLEIPEIMIGRLQPDEWSAYKALRLEALETEPQAFCTTYAGNVGRPDDQWRRRLDVALEGVASTLLFAKAGDQVVGMLGCDLKDDDSVAEITAVYVTPAFRGRGVARKLISYLLDELAAHPAVTKAVLTVNKDQLRAVALYESMGFRTASETLGEMGDGVSHVQCEMERPFPLAASADGFGDKVGE